MHHYLDMPLDRVAETLGIPVGTAQLTTSLRDARAARGSRCRRKVHDAGGCPMSTDRDTTRIVRSWLRTDEHESADRVLDAVLDQLDTTPQRRATWWPARRFPDMNNSAKLGPGGRCRRRRRFPRHPFPAAGDPGIGGPSPSPDDPCRSRFAERRGPSRSGHAMSSPTPLDADSVHVYGARRLAGRWRRDLSARTRASPARSGFAAWGHHHVYGTACHWAGSLVELGRRWRTGRGLAEQLPRGGAPGRMVTVGGHAGASADGAARHRTWPSSA